MRFDAELRLNGMTATGVPVPEDVIDGLGGGRRPRVNVTLNGYAFQTSLGTMSGEVMIPVSAGIRSAAGVAAGDRLDVEVELATEPARVAVPEDLRAALAAEPEAHAFFDGLTSSQQRGYTEWIEQAKRDDTRQRRLEQTVEALRERRSRR
ncbi:YdeI/OmpD-associated family protein [Actinopolymorpha alba]|uniref:YdeI/OmpD-associated family protein n=1 Tax=Actinopolymorpha alba TaxID=533267 RepID=UPI00036824F4|nr:YdeI/OmpD-associated family protein [Actinopolymorpha alba]